MNSIIDVIELLGMVTFNKKKKKSFENRTLICLDKFYNVITCWWEMWFLYLLIIIIKKSCIFLYCIHNQHLTFKATVIELFDHVSYYIKKWISFCYVCKYDEILLEVNIIRDEYHINFQSAIAVKKFCDKSTKIY